MEAVEAGMEDVILSDLLQRPQYYPYSTYGNGYRGSQGIYLARLTPSLTAAFSELANGIVSSDPFAPAERTMEAALEFAEGERSQRERSFFKRNPALRGAAIRKHGLKCIGCEFIFGEKYGALGEGYIEIHHLNALAERADLAAGKPMMTTLDEVVPLCANCHRIVHRRRPALLIEELKSAISQAATRTQIN
jgi:predicted HNH restriction endonuclease